MRNEDLEVQFRTGRSTGSVRFEAVKVWLTAQGFDVNVVPLDAMITIGGGQVTADVYERSGRDLRIVEQTLPLVSAPSDLVMGVPGTDFVG